MRVVRGRRRDPVFTLPAAIAITDMPLGTDAALPILLWVAVVLLSITSIPLGRRRSTQPADEWYAPMTGPPAPDDGHNDGAGRPPSGVAVRHRTVAAPMTVTPPAGLPTLSDVVGHRIAAAQLEDLVGPVLRAGRRPYRRSWGGVLLYGDTAADAALLVRAVAGEHEVPLVTVRASNLVRSPLGSAVGAVFRHVREHAPCVLMIADLGTLSTQDTSSRRAHSDLLTHLRGLARSERVVVVGFAAHADDVAPSLRGAGGFDRPVALGVPTASERDRIVRREVMLHAAVLDAVPQAIAQTTAGLAASQVRAAVAAAVQAVRSSSAVCGAPPTVTARDLREGVAALHASPGIAPLAFGPVLVRRLTDLVARLQAGQATGALALLGRRGNGTTTAARWVAQQCDGGVMWMTGGDLAVLTSEDLDAVIDGVMAQRSPLVVMDDIDEAFAESATIDPKRLGAALECLLATRTVALLLTARERRTRPWAGDLDDQIEWHWIGHPAYRERMVLIRQVDPDADEASVAALAAKLHGATRWEVVAASAAARDGMR